MELSADETPDLVIDFSGDETLAPELRTVRLLFDGIADEATIFGALLAGRMPTTRSRRAGSRTIIARGVPCADNAATVSDRPECVLARVVTLIVSVAHGHSTYLFVEDFDHRSGKALISVVPFTSTGRAARRGRCSKSAAILRAEDRLRATGRSALAGRPRSYPQPGRTTGMYRWSGLFTPPSRPRQPSAGMVGAATFPGIGTDKVGLAVHRHRRSLFCGGCQEPRHQHDEAGRQPDEFHRDRGQRRDGRQHGNALTAKGPVAGPFLSRALIAKGSIGAVGRRTLGTTLRKREAPQAGPVEGGNAMITRRQHCPIPLAQPNKKAAQMGQLPSMWPFRHTLCPQPASTRQAAAQFPLFQDMR